MCVPFLYPVLKTYGQGPFGTLTIGLSRRGLEGRFAPVENENTTKNYIDYLVEILARVEIGQKVFVTMSTSQWRTKVLYFIFSSIFNFFFPYDPQS